MKGKVLSIITAILFGATMVASPIVFAAGTDDTVGAAGTEEKAPAEKKPAKKKKMAKKPAEKKAKKKTSKKKKAPAEEKE